jgi:uncharacterized protein YjeT (DUF2065 family)
MADFVLYIGSAVALILVIEGLAYALFTDYVRGMMRMALDLPPENLRNFGYIIAVTGFVVIWILHMVAGA